MSAEKQAKEVSAVRRFGPLAILILAAQIGIAWVLIQTLLVPKPPQRGGDDAMLAQELMGVETKVTEDETVAKDLPYYLTIEALSKIAVNPAGTEGTRFMLATLQLGIKVYDRDKKPPGDDITATLTEEPDLLKTLEPYGGIMRSIATESFSQQPLEVFEQRQLTSLQEEIRDRINREVLRPAFTASEVKKEFVVVEVLFTDLVIQ